MTISSLSWEVLTAEERQEVLRRPQPSMKEGFLKQVETYTEDVRNEGDKAIKEFQHRFSGLRLETLRVRDEEFLAAQKKCPKNVQSALVEAHRSISFFHKKQIPQDFSCEPVPGVTCQFVHRPLASAGLYVPGGEAPLVSSVLMQAIPAKIAGIRNTLICSPPDAQGNLNPAILVACSLCGVRDVFKVGGAHAIAAMAYGTETIPPVLKIFGPGNEWVTAAKSLVSQAIHGAAIDMPAGPSEIMVIADHTSNPDFVAADILSQAEHGHNSQLIVVVQDQNMLLPIKKSIETQIVLLPNKKLILSSLKHSSLLWVSERQEIFKIIETYAPEHLILNVENASAWLSKISHVGSVFLGAWTPESLGDYASGTNHVLPTYGWAKVYSGLSVRDFYRHLTVQEATKKGLENIAPVIQTLAKTEGLLAHHHAVSIRLTSK